MVEKTLAAGTETPERIYAVGDVHGHAEKLRALHDAIGADLQHRPVASALLVHLGDYVDRGPDSAGCLAILRSGPPVPDLPMVNLMGNHERMMLNALADPARAPLWMQNGGDTTLQSWGIAPSEPPDTWRAQIPAEDLALIGELSLCHVAGRYVFVHAGVRPGTSLGRQVEHDLLWIREEFLFWQGPMLPDWSDGIVVHGHTPTAEPEVLPHRIGIDTNAGRGGKLTCAALSADSVYFLQV